MPEHRSRALGLTLGVALRPWLPALTLVAIAATETSAQTSRTQATVPASSSLAPCCEVTGIDMRTGIVTGFEPENGRRFQFKPAREKLASLKTGQKLWADFRVRRVSLDWGTPCCELTSLGLQEANGVLHAAWGTPCCEIAAIDVQRGVVTGFEPTNGHRFEFSPGRTALRSLKIGQKLWVDFGTKKVSVDGAVPCCDLKDVTRR